MIIAPSILSADFARMADEFAAVEAAGSALGADVWVHVDVMDGHFVPNLTFGPPLIKKWRAHSKLPFDVHLMIENAEETVEQYIDAGADWLTVHYEAVRNPVEVLGRIRKLGAKAGISIKPKTAAEDIFELLEHVDLVLVMTVEPGFGGQSFMEDMMPKIVALKAEIERRGLDVKISVDGGIAEGTIKTAYDAGARVFVAGSAVFKGDDYKQTMGKLIGACA